MIESGEKWVRHFYRYQEGKIACWNEGKISKECQSNEYTLWEFYEEIKE